jgi:hypothetical protein
MENKKNKICFLYQLTGASRVGGPPGFGLPNRNLKKNTDFNNKY